VSTDPSPPNYLDFLVVLDQWIRKRPDGCVRSGFEMHQIAQGAGLAEAGNEIAANWAGILVELGYLSHGPISMGDRRPVPPGRMWNSTEAQRFNDYRLTASGREEADRLRRQTREVRTESALKGSFPHLLPAWLGEHQRRALAEPVASLQAALDGGRAGESIGAAKDLVEAACKIVLERAGKEVRTNRSLTTLFKEAVDEGGSIANDLGRSLTGVVQRLAELRNSAGAGHGRSSVPDRSAREALLAASTATSIVAFLLLED
jgi:Abortive infection C-terminus